MRHEFAQWDSIDPVQVSQIVFSLSTTGSIQKLSFGTDRVTLFYVLPGTVVGSFLAVEIRSGSGEQTGGQETIKSMTEGQFRKKDVHLQKLEVLA